MDRYTVNIAKSQAGFIDVICFPLFKAISNFLPELAPKLANFEANKREWEKLVSEYEEKLGIYSFTEEKLKETPPDSDDKTNAKF